LFLPDEQVYDAEHEARGDHHDPGSLDPVHLVAYGQGAGAKLVAMPKWYLYRYDRKQVRHATTAGPDGIGVPKWKC